MLKMICYYYYLLRIKQAHSPLIKKEKKKNEYIYKTKKYKE